MASLETNYSTGNPISLPYQLPGFQENRHLNCSEKGRSNREQEVRMLIKIKYKNNRFDLIKGDVLGQFIQQGKIKEFYRYSEDRWVNVESDPIRLQPEKVYSGREKRFADLKQTSRI
jgi:hypothetical protein